MAEPCFKMSVVRATMSTEIRMQSKLVEDIMRKWANERSVPVVMPAIDPAREVSCWRVEQSFSTEMSYIQYGGALRNNRKFNLAYLTPVGLGDAGIVCAITLPQTIEQLREIGQIANSAVKQFIAEYSRPVHFSFEIEEVAA